MGGDIQLEDHVGDNPFLLASPVRGLRLPVVWGYVCRTDDSASEYISDDPERPTIFQNLITQLIPAGKISIPGRGNVPMPFEYSVSAFTEGVGFIADGNFVGTMRLSYNFDFSKMQSQIRHMLALQSGNIPDHSYVTGQGVSLCLYFQTFEVKTLGITPDRHAT